MRNLSRTTISLLLGAAMLAPVAAAAQERGRDRGGYEYGRAAMQNGDGRREMMQRQRPERPVPATERPQIIRPDAGADARRQWQAPDRAVDRAQRDPVRREQQAERRDWGRDRDRVELRDERRDWNRDRERRVVRDGDGRDWNRDGRDGNRSWTTDRRDWDGRNWDRRDDRRWDRDWRNDRRYSWQDYRARNRHIYRAPRYEGYYGYSYRRWSPGYRFDPWAYSSSYWIDDPYYYRLPPAYGHYRWIRYYDDVALVDIRSGLIVDIIYAFFLR